MRFDRTRLLRLPLNCRASGFVQSLESATQRIGITQLSPAPSTTEKWLTHASSADSGERINRGPLANCTACDRAGSTCQQRGLFRRCDLFDWRSFGLGLLARFIGGVQEPIDQPSAALLHDLRVLGLLLVVVDFVIFRVAHGILHLRSAPTVKQLRNTVYSSELTIVPQFLSKLLHET